MKLWNLLAALFLVLALSSNANATKGPLKDLLGFELEGIGKWKIWEGFKLKKLGNILTIKNFLKPGLGFLGLEVAEAVSPSENVFLIEDPKTGVRVMAIDKYENSEIYQTPIDDDTKFKINYPIHNTQYPNQYPAPHPIHYTDDPYEAEGRQESQIVLTKSDDDALPSLPLELKIKEFLNQHAKEITEQYIGKTKMDYIKDYYQDDYHKSESPQLYWYTFDQLQKMSPLKISHDEHGTTKFEHLDGFTLPNNYEIKKDEKISSSPDLSFYVVQPATNPQVIEKERSDFAAPHEFLLITKDLDEHELEDRDFSKRSPYQYNSMPMPYYGYESIVGADNQQASQIPQTPETPKTPYYGYEGFVGAETAKIPEQPFQQFQGFRAADGEVPQHQQPQPEGKSSQAPQTPQQYYGYRAAAEETPKVPEVPKSQYHGFEGVVGAEKPITQVQGFYGIEDTEPKSPYYGYQGIVGSETPKAPEQSFKQYQGYRALDDGTPSQEPQPEGKSQQIPQSPQQFQGYRAMTEESPKTPLFHYEGFVGAETPETQSPAMYGYQMEDGQQQRDSLIGVTGPQAGDEVGTFFKGNPFAVTKYNSGYGSYYDKLGKQNEGEYKSYKYYSNYNINYGGGYGQGGYGGGHGGYGQGGYGGGYGHGGYGQGGYGHGGYGHGGYGGRYYRSPEDSEELTTQKNDELISAATTSTGIPIFFKKQTKRAHDDLTVSETNLHPFVAFTRCLRSCPSCKEEKPPTVQETLSTTDTGTCNVDGVLSGLKRLAKYLVLRKKRELFFERENPPFDQMTFNHKESSLENVNESSELFNDKNNQSRNRRQEFPYSWDQNYGPKSKLDFISRIGQNRVSYPSYKELTYTSDSDDITKLLMQHNADSIQKALVEADQKEIMINEDDYLSNSGQNPYQIRTGNLNGIQTFNYPDIQSTLPQSRSYYSNTYNQPDITDYYEPEYKKPETNCNCPFRGEIPSEIHINNPPDLLNDNMFRNMINNIQKKLNDCCENCKLKIFGEIDQLDNEKSNKFTTTPPTATTASTTTSTATTTSTTTTSTTTQQPIIIKETHQPEVKNINSSSEIIKEPPTNRIDQMIYHLTELNKLSKNSQLPKFDDNLDDNCIWVDMESKGKQKFCITNDEKLENSSTNIKINKLEDEKKFNLLVSNVQKSEKINDEDFSYDESDINSESASIADYE